MSVAALLEWQCQPRSDLSTNYMAASTSTDGRLQLMTCPRCSQIIITFYSGIYDFYENFGFSTIVFLFLWMCLARACISVNPVNIRILAHAYISLLRAISLFSPDARPLFFLYPQRKIFCLVGLFFFFLSMNESSSPHTNTINKNKKERQTREHIDGNYTKI